MRIAMCDFCNRYDFRRVRASFMWESPSICLVGALQDDQPDTRRFRFCPLCGRELTDADFQDKSE